MLRNVTHVEFWKTDDEHRQLGVREAPIYDLEAAEIAIKTNDPVKAIEETLMEVDEASE